MADKLLLKGQGNVDVQPGGPGNNWKYLSACSSMGGPSVSFGAIETRWCQDPDNAGKFKRSLRFRTASDDITFDVMTKFSTVDKLAQLNCPFGLRARYLQCEGQRSDPSQYDPLMLGYTPVDLESIDRDDLVVTDPNDEDEIIITAPANAAYEYLVSKMTSPTRIGTATTIGDEELVSITFCSNDSCGGSCGARSDTCSTIYALSAGAGALYSTPTLLVGTKDPLTGLITWESKEIVGATGTFDQVICAGSRVIVASQELGEVAYSDDGGDTWSFVAIANGAIATGALSRNFIFARTAQEIWLAMGSGYLYKSTDGGLSFTAIMSGDVTTEDFASVYAYDEDTIVVSGENSNLYRTTNAGRSWTDLGPAISAEIASAVAVLMHAVIPPKRDLEIYVAIDDGRIFRTKDAGVTWSEVTFSGSGVGSVDKIRFYGPWSGEVMFFTQTNASNQTRLMRDLSGGAGGSDVEEVVGYTEVLDAGIELHDFDVCTVNYGLLVGVEESGYPVMIEAS
jgi:photosystem II stability/assembly factor-like uncharacterized protein